MAKLLDSVAPVVKWAAERHELWKEEEGTGPQGGTRVRRGEGGRGGERTHYTFYHTRQTGRKAGGRKTGSHEGDPTGGRMELWTGSKTAVQSGCARQRHKVKREQTVAHAPDVKNTGANESAQRPKHLMLKSQVQTRAHSGPCT